MLIKRSGGGGSDRGGGGWLVLSGWSLFCVI